MRQLCLNVVDRTIFLMLDKDLSHYETGPTHLLFYCTTYVCIVISGYTASVHTFYCIIFECHINRLMSRNLFNV